jgi:hypothetical protein
MAQPSNSQTADVLAQFPGPVTLSVPGKVQIRSLVIAVSFIAIALALLHQDPSSKLAWLGLSFFGLCAIAFVISALPRATSLTLDRDGFVAKRAFIQNRSRWQDVTNFVATAATPPAPQDMKFVWFNDTQWQKWKLARMETALLGYNAALPATYGFPAEDLANLMASWRDRALQAGPVSA